MGADREAWRELTSPEEPTWKPQEICVFLIATSKVPIHESEFVETLKQAADSFGVQLVAIKGTPGPGCYNIAIKLISESASLNEQIAQHFTVALGPVSRYCRCVDDINGFEFTF